MSRLLDPRLRPALPVVRRLLVTLPLAQAVAAVLTVAQAVLLADVLAGLVLHPSLPAGTGSRLVLLAVVLGCRALLAAAEEWLTARASSRGRADLRRAVLRAVTRLGPSWAQRQPAGRLALAAGPGLEALDGYLTRALPALTAAAAVPVLVLAAIAVVDVQSALVLVLTLPLVPVFMVLVGATTQRRVEAQYATLARLAGHFLDLVEGLTTLKVYGQARRQVDGVRRATDAYRVETMQTLRVALLSGLVLDLLATLSVAVVAVDVGLRLRGGSLGLQPALLVLLLAPELFAPLRAMGTQHHAAKEGQVACAAALDVLDEAATLPALSVAGGPAPSGDLRVRGLTVTHPGRGGPALSGVDLDVPAGTTVVLTGSSGAGKSTLLAVLLRLVEPTGGTVAIGGADLPHLDPTAWRHGLAWSPQRPRTTQPTVGAEVLLGDATATGEQVEAVLVDCCALPSGTPLGEDGTHVSAGQRRRVALARALLRARAVASDGGVPLVLLDEPSEDLDAETEQVVGAVIASMSGWATVLVATHSPALARLGHRRVQLCDGRVVADVAQRPVPLLRPAVVPVRGRERTDTAPLPARTTLRQLLALLGSGRTPGTDRRLAAAALLSGAVGLAGLALLATSLWLICRAAQHPEVQSLALAVVGVRAFALARAGLRYAERLVSHDAALRLLADVRARVFAVLVPLAPAGLAELRRGDLLRRFVSDVDGVQDVLVRTVVPVAGALLTAVGAVALAGLLVPTAGVVLAVGLLVALLGVPALTRGLAGDGTQRARTAGRRDARTTALLDGLVELTAYDAVDAALAQVDHDDAVLVRAARRPALAAAAGTALSGLTATATLVLVLPAAPGRPSVAAGVLVACVLAGFDALAPLPAALAAWSGCRAGLERVAALLQAGAPVPEPARPQPVPAGRVGVALHAATVAPSLRAPALLPAADLLVLPGERVALVGPSGCGKSTVLTTVLRLLPVRAGRASLETGDRSVSLSAVAAADVPPVVAGSLQGDHVFATSLRDNLRVVRPTASDADLDAVAARAGLTPFVRGLPDGWSTLAGADGAALSGGERQRLLLARALLADPAVLVLDEPTAHLDAATERAVLDDLLAGTSGRTLLLSTHRPLRTGEVDRVLQLRDGALVSPSLPPAESLSGTRLEASPVGAR